MGRRFFVFKKKERKSILWHLSGEELEPYRWEFLERGYTYMTKKYHIARADLRRILGRKPRTIKNPFYVEMRDEQKFLRAREEYYSKNSDEFARKYRIGIRQARRLFGVKHWNKVRYPERYEPKKPPVELDRSEAIPYYRQEDYWRDRGVG